MKWWFIRTSNAEPSPKVPLLDGGTGDILRIFGGLTPVMFLNKKIDTSGKMCLFNKI